MISMAYVRNERFTDFRVTVRVTNRAWPVGTSAGAALHLGGRLPTYPALAGVGGGGPLSSNASGDLGCGLVGEFLLLHLADLDVRRP